MRHTKIDDAMKTADVGALASIIAVTPISSNPIEHKTIAQCVKRSSEPYTAAINSFLYRDVGHMTKTFHFADGSYLVFECAYTAAETGMKS